MAEENRGDTTDATGIPEEERRGRLELSLSKDLFGPEELRRRTYRFELCNQLLLEGSYEELPGRHRLEKAIPIGPGDHVLSIGVDSAEDERFPYRFPVVVPEGPAQYANEVDLTLEDRGELDPTRPTAQSPLIGLIGTKITQVGEYFHCSVRG